MRSILLETVSFSADVHGDVHADGRIEILAFCERKETCFNREWSIRSVGVVAPMHRTRILSDRRRILIQASICKVKTDMR